MTSVGKREISLNDLSKSQVRKLIDSMPPETFDRELHLHNLLELIRDADSEELLERIALAGYSNRVMELGSKKAKAAGISIDVEDIGLPPRSHEFLIGLIVEHGGGGNQSVTYQELVRRFAQVHDAYILNEIALFASGVNTLQTLTIQTSLLHRELTAGRFRETEQLIPAARRSYRPFDEEMTKSLGFTIDEALHVVGFFVTCLERSIRQQLDRLEIAKQFHALDLNEDECRHIPQMANSSRLRQTAEFVDKLYSHHSELDLYWFTPSHVITTLPGDITSEQFLNVLSALRVKVGDTSSIPKGPFSRPVDGPNPIDVRPLVELNGRVLPASGDAMLRSLAETFYHRIFTEMSRTGRKKEFGRRWGKILEEWTADILETVFPQESIIVGASYKNGETDFLIEVEESLLVVECKSKKLPLETREGDLDVLQYHVEEGIGNALSQAERTIRRLQRHGELMVTSADGSTRMLYADDYSRYHPIIVTRDFYDNIATADYSELLAKLSVHPLIVDVFNLEMVADIFDTPEAFHQYVTDRRRVAVDQSYYSMDEADYIGLYLKNNRSFPPIDTEGPLQINDKSDLVRGRLSDDFGVEIETAWSKYR